MSFASQSVSAQTGDIFYYVSDDDNRLYSINRNTGVTVNIGATGRSAIEAIAYFPIPGSQTLYAADAGDFGTLNTSTGVFTLIGEIDGGGTADGSAGAQTLNDVDGLMLDGQTLTMWAVERNSGNPDLLFQIDIVTGQFVPDAFGAGVDYLEITGEGLNLDVDDIAVDPVSGEIYGVSNNGGTGDVLFRVNRSTGEFIFVTNLAQSDVEGLAFSNNGNLYGSEGNANNRLSLINKATGAMTNFRSFDPGATGNPGDVEGLAALVADANLITGTVWEDTDLDGIKDGGETTGIENVVVYLYIDQNGDGQVDPEDTRIQSTLTDSNGDYSFFYVTTGTLLTTTQGASYPVSYSLTTDNVETMSFTDGDDFGETDANNDFGLATGTDCDGDGLTDFFEGLTDSDGDGVLDQCDLDSDNDGILDSVEGTEDFDDDGVPNYLDRDSDDDGIPDAIEANGGIRPAEYVASQGNLSGAVGANGIVDTRETVAESGIMLASNPDSDGDTYLDYLDLDSDNDGILDLREAGATVDSDGDGQVDSIVDANGNGYADALESSPLAVGNADLFYENSNGLTQRPDYIDIDSDADGIDDTREGLSTLGYRFPTLFGDDDDDGILDFWDVSNGSDPITPVDTDLDGTPDYLDINSDNDARSDFIEGNDADDNDVADIPNTGLDANGNGLDDAFDGGCAVTLEETSTATDHAEEDNTNGSIDLASTDLELVNEDQNQTVGVYFPNVGVAQGATISSAYIQFEADEVQTGSITIAIRGELSTNAGTFSTTTDDVSDRLTPGTIASESWSPADWNTIGEAAAAQRTVDISSIIEEIVQQGGWSSGNAIVIIFTGPSGNRRTAEVVPQLIINVFDGPTLVCSSNVAHQDTDLDGEDDFRDFEGVALDTDGDGVPDVDDIDDDNDGILDVDEGEATDTDGDGIVNSLDLDSDNDGILDIIEAGGVDTDEDGRVDSATDTDGDGWANTFDSDNSGTALANPDTDGDGIKNFLDLDSDGDGIVDLIESQATTGTPVIPVGTDTDGDGIDNAFDVTGGTPTDPEDTDSDGTPDYIDLDSDNDGFRDIVEAWDTDGDLIPDTVPTGIDSDLDGLDNAFDDVFGPNSTTNIYNSEDALDFPNVTTSGLTSERDWREDNAIDSDGDGQINSNDIDDDDDGILDVDEGTGDFDNDGVMNSLDLDSDNDGIPDIIEAGGVDTDDDGRVDDNTDTDNDGWADTFDSDNGGTALAEPDTDGDGKDNYVDVDSDGDGIVDLIESQATTGSPTTPSGTDTDGDGLDNSFDTDNGGTPTDPVDTDTDSTPDYLDLNSDNDSFTDAQEGWDTDGDLTANTVPSGIDSDNDGLDDAYDDVVGPNNTTNATNSQTAFAFPDVTTAGDSERDWRESNATDSDFDGIPDSTDIDDDNDGILDTDEGASTDTDGDGIVDRLDLDSDNDGIPDIIEAGGVDTDNDGRVDNDTDTDGDGWANTFDSDNGGTALPDPDTDNDSINDYLDLDSDNDGIEDIIEAGGVDTDNDGVVDSTTDTDEDGWADTFDGDNGGTVLANPDTDGDGLANNIDIDADGDGIVDLIESQATTGSPIIPTGSDSDGDGIDNAFDVTGGTPITPVDTDADLTPDYIDFNSDNDSFPDALEGWDTDDDQVANTLPDGLDSDGDGLDDAYDDVVGPNSTNNIYNDQDANDFPDVSTSGITSERDWREINVIDTDFDGIPDATDIDDDNDGILDVDEGEATDSDGDGIVNSLDLDSDNDGIPDIIEAGGVDNDYDGKVDVDTDTDGDGWANTFDSDNGGTALAEPDSDNDGVKNYIDLDSDNDGILDVIEANYTDANGDGKIDDFFDANGTGFDDSIEGSVNVLPNTDLAYENTNGLPNLPNYIDIDSDADGIDDTREGYSTDDYEFPSDFTDSDGDGILNFWDVDSGNTPITPVDTDAAGLPDYIDLNSDNDFLSDFIEGNDFNEDGIADVANTGLDTNGNGLDDAFDQECYGSLFSVLSTDYAEESNSDGSIDLGSTDLELVTDAGVNQTVGVYFSNITVANAATINSAYIQFQTDETETGAVNITIRGELIADASTFSATVDDVSDRLTPGTTASESWSPADWNTIGESSSAQRTVDISSIIQEIVNQGGWSSGNDLVIIFTGPADADTRTAENNPTLFINYGSGITFCSSNVALQDGDGDGEHDFRDNNGTAAPLDTDADGIADVDDIDDDNDGILDTVEGCTDTVITGANGSSASQTVATVTNTGNAINGVDAIFASFSTDGAQMEVELRSGSLVVAGTAITIRAQRTDANILNRMTVSESTDGINYVNTIEYSFAAEDTYEDKIYNLTTDATHIRITYLRVAGDLRVDNVSYAGFTIVCPGTDTDSDGIPDHLDIDADGDGIVDVIESQATTGTPILPLGVDTDGDGLDDAFDGDCAPCGAVTGVPTVLEDTDGDLTPDFRDFNSDGDTFSDALEGWDTDGNLVANTVPSGTDTDGDGLDDAYDTVAGINSTNNVYNDQDANDFPDVTTLGNVERDWREVNVADSDFDGIQDSSDIDDDNDGILDVDETGDTDGDGIIDSLDLDSDNDGIPDIIEAGGVDADNDGRVDDNTDTDNDGWANTFDSDNGGTALPEPDTDNDGIDDHVDLDSDNDGIEDIIEAGGVDTDDDGVVDDDTDLDEDGWANTFDSDNGGTVLANGDLDGDGLANNIDIDADGDGIVDLIESQATTGTPVIPVGTDTDGDGIDNAFDTTGGTPTTPVDTDGDGTPDYLDFNSDNDSMLDALEGWDTDGDFTPDTTPTGIDTDGDGLDNAYDNVVGPNSTTNIYNNEDALDFPDVTTSAETSERDWREANVIDSDFDGVADVDDIDDDNDGILDTDEGDIEKCYISAVISESGVLNSANITGAPDTNFATIPTNGDIMVVDFGQEYPAGTQYEITWQRTSGQTGTAIMVLSESTSPASGFVEHPSPPQVALNAFETDVVTSNVAFRYLQITKENPPSVTDFDIDAIGVICSLGTDTDNDGIPDRLDLDSDNDGILDIIESGGVDSDDDGRVDSDTDTDGDGWANTFDSDNGGTALTDPDSDTDDFENRIDIDSDDDGIVDLIESQATTGTPVIPVGSDFDQDGIDDSFDVNCIPCGGVTGVPTVLANTDGADVPDYLDVDSDNDGLNDVIEAWDEDGDYLPDTTPSGTDSDDDGLDDAFDDVLGPNATTNNYNGQTANDFPDITTVSTTTERDWRETNLELCEPGGIGNILLWLKADNGGTAWRDLSNNYETVTEVGTLNNGANINFNPTNFFDGTDYYNTTLSINADTYQDLAVIVVYQPAANNAGAAWGEDNGSFDRYMLDADGVGENQAVSNGTGTEDDITGLYSALTTTMSTIIFDEDQSSGSSVSINGRNSLAFTSDHGGETSNNFQIGAKGDGSEIFTGLIAEVIVYNQLLTPTLQRQQIEGYLALKYGITLSTDTDGDASTFEAGEGDYISSDDNVVFWDADENTSFQNNVAGIARDDASCLIQLQSKSINSDAIVTMGLDDNTDGLEASNSLNGSTFSNDLSALVWGHDGEALHDIADNVDIDRLLVNSRLNREWRVQETGTVGTVTVQFDVSDLLGLNGVGTNDESQIVLLIDADGNFASDASIVSQSFEVNGDGLVSFRVDFTDGFYFTLGSSEHYALPITLISFTATAQKDNVLLNWTTASEDNNGLFRLERSLDGVNFETIGYMDGAGTTQDINRYSFKDQSPNNGKNYYRLIDIDNNGVENASSIVLARYSEITLAPKPYPNPMRVGSEVYIDLPASVKLGSISMHGVNGSKIRVRTERRNGRLVVSSQDFNQGLYILSVILDDQRYNFKIMVNN